MNTARLVADSESDRDSALDVGDDVEVMTVSSAVFRYRQENGRTYHAYKDGRYLLPNDQTENERLVLQHYLFLYTFHDQLHISLLPKRLHRVLDAGCGTGDWTIDFADSHPECHVTGVDLSPIQPVYVPQNVSFIVDDLEEETWAFGPRFDFIFSRFMTGSISNWPEFFRKSYESLNPGGVIELQDSVWRAETDDGTVPPDSHLARWADLLRSGMHQFGRPIDSALHYKEQLEEAGFVDVVQYVYKWPTNHWPKDRRHKMIGKWNHENFTTGLSGISLALMTRSKEQKGLGWTVDEVEALLEGVRRDLRDTGMHAYFPVYVVYGRKPDEDL